MDSTREVKKNVKEQNKKSSISGIFKFADSEDILLMMFGTIGAIGDGCSTNCLLLFASNIMNNLGQGNMSTFMHDVEKYCLYFIYLGVTVLIMAFLEGYCWSRTSERQILRLRYKYLEAVLKQEVGYFKSKGSTTSEIINAISKDASAIQDVLSEKVPIFIVHSSVFISGIIFSVYFSWRLSLVALPLLLLLVIPGLVYGKYLLRISHESHREYAKASAVVEQALSSIKTIYSFTAEKTVVEKYETLLGVTVRLGIRQGIAKGLAVGTTGLSYATWAVLAWYGSKLVMHHGESGGRVYASGVSFVLGGLSLGMAVPELKHFSEASVAAARILEWVERVPCIDTEDQTGMILDNFHGEIEFKGVEFAYPSRPDSIILNNFSLSIPAGKTVAMVGSSGSGKSTIVNLLQRFYDANEGMVRIDGVDIKKLQLKWLRGRMGLVSQDQALFGVSITENIMMGKPDATTEEVMRAAMVANAHDFIRQLPEGYETNIGEKGSLLSGGQKQRIAIARAIIRNPSILLLDEATSALDSESEKIVQIALDQASLGRTTLVIAHKLSTIRNADQIAVMDGGKIVEVGSHVDLISKDGGQYTKLAKLNEHEVGEEESAPSLPPSTARSSVGRPSLALAKCSPFILPSKSPEPYSSTTIPPSFSRLVSMCSSEWKQALLGCVSGVVCGSLRPTYAFSIGGTIAAFFVSDHKVMQEIIQRYVLIFSSLSVISIIFDLVQHYNFAYLGEMLMRRIRVKMLEKVLSFEPAWFDEESNSSGQLCSRLSLDATMVKTIVADRASLFIQTASSVLIAMAMGLMITWKLALLMIALQPLVILCYYTKRVAFSSMSREFVRAQTRSTQVANEAVFNHTIVTSFGCGSKILNLFDDAQEEPRKATQRKAWVAGITMGCSPCLSFLTWALAFWYGGKLIKAGEISAAAVFKTFFILVSTGKAIAEAGSMTSDLAKGATAIASVFHILDRQSLITTPKNHALRRTERLQGKVEMVRVDFAYPSRPSSLVLHDFSLEVKPGESIGLVGGSGCGKSTVVNLIQRFYDVDRGSVRIDDTNIRELDASWFRRFTALVSQDPVIFSGSIHQNITFGNPEASEDEVVEAAKAASAHEFISSLKNGYQTDCGDHGVQLSGGQKQRIAIARAIIRNPTILMLDEATSALDVQSELVVQEALDRIMVGRTTIVVAHRLNTVKMLNSIAVMVEGKVAERGRYSQLMSKRGSFFNLVSLQT